MAKKRRKKPSIFSNIKKRLEYLKSNKIIGHNYKKVEYSQKDFAKLPEKEFRKVLKSYQNSLYRKRKKAVTIAVENKEIYTSKKFLGIWWSTTENDFDMNYYISIVSKMTDVEIINDIKSIYNNAKLVPDDSSSLKGFYLMTIADNKKDLNTFEKNAIDRRYTKAMMAVNDEFVEKFINLQDANIIPMVKGNLITKRGFLVLMGSLMPNLLNSFKIELYTNLYTFLKNQCNDLFIELKKDGLF